MSSWSLASAVSPNVTNPPIVGTTRESDAIRLKYLQSKSDTNINSADATVTTTPTSKQKTTISQTTLPRPTTPVPNRKLAAKKPAHLVLHTKGAVSVPLLATTENATLSTASSSVYATPLTSTPGGPISLSHSGSHHSSEAVTAPSASHSSSTYSNHSANSTSGSIFPHELWKTIKKVDIGFENVNYSAKASLFSREQKDILIGLTGHFRSGELTGILGPSGAGKSTLLNIISGYTSFGYSGDFRINGKPRDLKAFKPNVAFIRQDTSLQPFLSVKEAMHFAANLKVGSHMTHAEKRERVRCILEAIGMFENRNTRTGNLSGGQRKRLAIALELVNNPPVLVLDEPTTGLDSSTSTQLITLLKKLAMEGRTVICTIHQPSALTFAMFDHLYAISEGHCIYAGGTQNLVPFLAALGLNCPESYNPADYLMELATHDYDEENDRKVDKLIALMDNGRNDDYRQNKSARMAQLVAMKKVDQMMSAGLITPVTAPILSNPPSYPQRHEQHFKPMTPINELSSRVWDSHGGIGGDAQKSGGNCCKPKKKKKRSLPTVQLDLDPAHLCKRENIYATPFYRQLIILLLRTFLLIWRDNSLTTMRFAIHLLVGLLIGFLYYGIGNDAGNVMNSYRYCFYTIMFIMYCAFSGILVKFPLEFPIVSREHFNRWYSLRAYYVAITLADIPIQIICTSLFIVPTYLLTGQPLELMRFTLFFLIVFLTALVAQSIGLTVGAALSMQLGAILGPFFICPFLQFSGFFLVERDAPSYLRWLFDISFLKYSLDGAVLAIFGYDRKRLECHDSYCHYSRPRTLFKDRDMVNASYESAVIFMLGLFILLRIMAFYIMSFRLRLFR